jgi:hypothetical protein
MKANSWFWLILFVFPYVSYAQQRCGSQYHLQQAVKHDPSLLNKTQRIERSINAQVAQDLDHSISAKPLISIVKIPVIVHVVYHLPAENISDRAIQNQLAALNRDYRRMNGDSINTPVYFKSVAADARIEFELAKVDTAGRATTGIERVYSPVAKWNGDDQMKYKSNYGIDAWNADSYLNIWVCNMYDLLGYSSILGEGKDKDGVVINYTVFNDLEDGGAYNSGRTAVHEIGHWLGLKHLWGDADCGDDGIDDTPKQQTYTTGCPVGIRTSCGNGPNGDMYMNFMDYTNDPCMNLFTYGQRDHMQALFEDRQYRNSILSSKALGQPWTQSIPLPDSAIAAPTISLFPNPANSALTIIFKNDESWIGKEIVITSVTGQILMHHTVANATDILNVDRLKSGIYFIHGNNNGKTMTRKFVKL